MKQVKKYKTEALLNNTDHNEYSLQNKRKQFLEKKTTKTKRKTLTPQCLSDNYFKDTQI